MYLFHRHERSKELLEVRPPEEEHDAETPGDRAWEMSRWSLALGIVEFHDENCSGVILAQASTTLNEQRRPGLSVQ